MALRMAEYALRIYRQFGKFPLQIVLYVGEAPLRMAASMAEPDAVNPDFSYRYTLLDIRDLDAVTLLASSHIEDNLLAILTRLPDRLDTIRQILFRIAGLEPPARQAAFARFLIISGLRRLAPAVREEAQKMPILNDILDHEVIGPAILKGRQEGRQEGLQEGRQELLQRQLEKRFGPLPTWVIARLSGLSSIELDDVAVRLLESARLEQLFPEKQ
jgi:predicted transposase YdaD